MTEQEWQYKKKEERCEIVYIYLYGSCGTDLKVHSSTYQHYIYRIRCLDHISPWPWCKVNYQSINPSSHPLAVVVSIIRKSINPTGAVNRFKLRSRLMLILLLAIWATTIYEAAFICNHKVGTLSTTKPL